MKGHGTKFTRKMEDAIAALLVQKNVEEAARAAGISSATLLRWQKQPEFQKAYREARRAAYGQSIARLQQMTSAAVITIGKTLMDAGATASIRLRAAEAILNHATRAMEVEDLDARLSELERAADAVNRGR